MNNYTIKKQIAIGNIPHYRKIMPVMQKYIIPNLYGISLFHDQMLSPFNYNNKKFYKYRTYNIDEERTSLTFRPRLRNTQLVYGHAIIDNKTGRIINTTFKGEYDMIAFDINVYMRKGHVILPQSCDIKAKFRFMGNNIISRLYANYDCPYSVSDTVGKVDDVEKMDKIRPDSLNGYEEYVYRKYFEEKKYQDTISDKSVRRKNKIKEIAWDIIGDHMLNSMGAESNNAYVRFSPLLNPLYLSYSHSHGISYKMKINAQYNFSSNRYISFNPHIGYNFKIKKLYFTSPIRYTYNNKKGLWTELTWRNGNRITNSSVLDMIRNENRDTIDFSALDLDYFNDNMLQLSNNINIGKKLSVTIGFVYHQRSAVNNMKIEEMGKISVYRSFAPQITVQYRPYIHGPVFTANYERSLRNVLKSNTEYERYEFDASFKKNLRGLRQYNIRAGGGFYTNKSTDYFVDFSNFCDNYLPGGWDNDWTGQFQLLNSQWYNASKYYIRTNISYESPLLFLTRLPFVGKYIETERLYLSGLQIEHTQPYFEVGYGMTNRYFSIGTFGSLLNGRFYEFGCKFTFELFRKW